MSLYINKFSCWAPESGGFDDNPEFWKSWAQGKAELPLSSASPKLEYADPLFKRRLSQISRMTVEAVHGVSDSASDAKLLFCSFRGEICRQLKINKGLIEERDVSPAGFSISVFNTPPAAAAIVLGLKAGYSAVYPGNGDFKSAVISAEAPILCGKEKSMIFAYSDELIPQEYGCEQKPPFAFAAVLSSEKTENSVSLPEEYDTPEEFLKSIICQKIK